MLLGGSRLRGNDGVYTSGCHRPLTQFLSQSAGYNRMTAHRSYQTIEIESESAQIKDVLLLALG